MRTNPYVGPRSFVTGERLYGRDRELRQLTNLLISERIVLLYSPSGAGKTSLVQATLVPNLRDDEHFQVLPPIRVGAEPPRELPNTNRYVLSTLLSLESHRPVEQQLPLTELAKMTVDQYIVHIDDPESDGIVLIFDQFEEVLSVVPNDREAKEHFFAQIGAALRPRDRWALFSMREEYIARLDPFLREIPTRLTYRFRLDLLEAEAAMVAIQTPARAAGVTFTDEAAQHLINDLRKINVQQADGSTKQETGLYIEPVQLQVVCHQVWSQLPNDDVEISMEDVNRIGDVTQVLRSYYAKQVAVAAAEASVPERDVRDWCENQLITAQGIRKQGASGSLQIQAINALVERHLVRSEQSRGATWYELAHDRLIEPVLKDNEEWCRKNLSQLQRQAAFWNAESRQDGLLLRNGDLIAAKEWASVHKAELTKVEQVFLDRCCEAHAIIQHERRNNRLIRILAVVASLVGIIAAGLAGVAFQAEQKTKSRALANAALSDSNARPQHSILLALASQQIGTPNGGKEALQQLLTDMGGQPEKLTISPNLATFSANSEWLAIYSKPDDVETAPYQIFVQPSSGQDEPIRLTTPVTGSLSSLALNFNGTLLAGITDVGNLLVWDIASPQSQPRQLPGANEEGKYTSIIFSNKSQFLAAGTDKGQIYIWNSADLTGFEPIQGASQPITALAFNPNAETIAVGYLDGLVSLFPRTNNNTQPRTVNRHEEHVTAIAFSPDGKLIASGCSDSEIMVNAIWGGKAPLVFRGHASKITRLQFSTNNKEIVSSSQDGTVQIWNAVDYKQPALVLRGHEGWVLDVSRRAYSSEIVTVGRDGTIRHWNKDHPEATTIIHQHTREVASVAYSPDGKWLATGSIDKTILLWAIDGDQVRQTQKLSSSSSVWWVAFSADSQYLTSAYEDGNIEIWQVDTPKKPLMSITAHRGAIATAVSFSPDGKKLASVGSDGTLRLWDTSQPGDQKPLWEWEDSQALQVVAFSEDGNQMAAAGDTGVIRIWDINNLAVEPQQLPESEEHGPIYALAFRPKHPGQIIAGGFDAQLWMWDLNGEDRKPRSFTEKHSDWIISLAFSPNGSQLASASNDDTVRIWNPEQPTAIPEILRGHSADVVSVAFSHDGRWVASGSLDRTAIIWPMDLDTLKKQACTTAGRNLTLAEAVQIGDKNSTQLCPNMP
ncbi:MAG: hypothetical protein HGA19_00315 [Oscillochloris sp.]|nr:hypothetical protein [Oscillochloris sp.]